MAVPLFTIDPATKQLIMDGFDTMIVVLGKDCKLILDGDKSPCPNCYFDAVSMRSSGVYNGTGPRSFGEPPCPVCRGTGYDPNTLIREEIIKFSIRRNLKPSQVYPPGTLTRPVTLARIKGFATDLPIVLQAKYIILDYVNAKYMNERYKPISEPSLTGNIVDSRYFIRYLERSE